MFLLLIAHTRKIKMLIDVAFTPAEIQANATKVCIVIDVIRATSSLTVIASKKPENLILTTTIGKASKIASMGTSHPLLCGERKGLPPEGFDFGNSPAEYFKADLKGKSIIFTSSNGTRAIAEVLMSPKVYLGCFLNGGAVAEKAYNYAVSHKLDILLVCAGREEKFAVDDAYCAGYLVSRIVSKITAEQEFSLGDGAQASLGIFGYYRDDKRLMQMSGAGKQVIDIGLSEDLTFLLQRDLIDVVPELVSDDNSTVEYGFKVRI